MRIEGKVTAVHLNEFGGNCTITSGVLPVPAPAPAGVQAVSITFLAADADGYAALIGKQVVVEVNEVVA